MNALSRIFAALLRIVGALAGVAVAYLVDDAALQQAIAVSGFADKVDLSGARLIAHAVGGAVGYIIAAQVAGLLFRAPTARPGTRQDAAEAVPRLRRHLVDSAAPPVPSAMPRYLDPNPEPTSPVAVSFRELGLEHPSANEYPDPEQRYREDADDSVAFAEDPDRPDSAGSAFDEWSGGDQPSRGADDSNREAGVDAKPQAEPVPETDFAAPEAAPLSVGMQDDAMTAESVVPSEDESLNGEIAFVTPASGPEIVRHTPMPDLEEFKDRSPASNANLDARPLGASSESASVPQPESPAPARPMAYVEPSKPGFAMPSVGGDADWYDGAGDEEEDAEDDGAGYGSLIDVGLGKTHAPRGGSGQPGEAGLPPRPDGTGVSALPKGKPQDFRLREALAELMRLEEVDA